MQKHYKLKKVNKMLALKNCATTTYNNDVNYVPANTKDILKAIMESNKKHEKMMKLLAK